MHVEPDEQVEQLLLQDVQEVDVGVTRYVVFGQFVMQLLEL
jgi:hypothetical protein